MMQGECRQVVIVTGLSGAGKSSALHAFEDIGFQAIDNLPLTMLSNLVDEAMAGDSSSPIAVGIDSRTLHFSPAQFAKSVQDLRTRDDISLHVLFMDASDDVLMKRFSETRRVHPLSEGQLLRAAIHQEREQMVPVRELMDGLIDTSHRTGAETRRIILNRFNAVNVPNMVVTLMSFGFANGVPRDADMVLDVRFFRNPHYVAELKPKTGLEIEVSSYVKEDEGFEPFIEKTLELINFLLPRYRDEGKSYLTLAIGCTGGKHRSVTVVEHIAGQLALDGMTVNRYHREIAGDTGR
ncbi:RNase adapter RapZ [Kordiimonas gwangyangensis]|uniref:RNase adapter RapZ n=1 Tax=Kordiimonas gwangyangensis TaxID=288022 RepID=UPI00037C3443|nr:RNase adapter RapZ [Kordiimonas gwangyangensis]